jgi:hypothetical protein
MGGLVLSIDVPGIVNHSSLAADFVLDRRLAEYFENVSFRFCHSERMFIKELDHQTLPTAAIPRCSASVKTLERMSNSF